MTFEEFENVAHGMWEEIPSSYREGIDGLVVKREAEAHEEHEDYWTLGMCYTEPYPSGYSGPDTTRSFLALFHGSFVNVSDQNEDFDWEGEIWETITHELRHHLEFLASDDALEGVDYAMEEAFKREGGKPFDPWYYQAGEEVRPGIFEVEYDVYLERPWRKGEIEGNDEIVFEWEGNSYTIPVPDLLGDLHYVRVEGIPIAGWYHVVLVREIPFLERMQRMLSGKSLDLQESEAEARPATPRPGAGS